MKDERMIYAFEFELTDDILSQLNCKLPIDGNWDGNELIGINTSSDTRHSISLIKTELSHPKFVFQIFSEKLLKDESQQSEKLENEIITLDNYQQTDKLIQKSFEHNSQQTDVKLNSDCDQQTDVNSSHSASQTEINLSHSESQTTSIQLIQDGCQTIDLECTDTDAQTTIFEFVSTQMNTNESRMTQQHNSTLTDNNLGSLRDAESMVEVDTTDSMCQVATEMSEQGTQNCPEFCHATIQTCLLVNDATFQTENNPTECSEMQTTSSMANENHTSTQASSEVAEKDTQVLIETTQMDTQTFNGCLHTLDEETQAGVLMVCDEAQTETDSKDQDTSTDHNLLTQRSTTTQACIEMSSQSQQTTLHGLNFSEESIINQMQAEDDKLNISELKLDSSKFLLNSTLDHSVGGDVSLCLSSLHHEAASQTDPVTIIIGDASFLVQKLKSAAVNSSKVTTSGNEIEIELSVDNETVKEKPQHQQNRQQQQNKHKLSKQPQQQTKQPKDIPSQQAALKPRMGGVRMRMPVTTLTPRINNHPCIVPTTPQLIRPTKAATEGMYSCPFCSLNFSESPALYQHLSDVHKSDTKAKWRKSQGREGKTIIPRHNLPPKPNKKKTGVQDVVVSEAPKRKKAGVAEGVAKVARMEDDEKVAVK